MIKNSNASPEVFLFDFQVNATIFLLLNNIKEVKAVVKDSSDFSNVRRNHQKAVTKVVIAKAIHQRYLIDNISREVSL